MNLEKKHNIATDFQQHLAHVWKNHFLGGDDNDIQGDNKINIVLRQ